MRVIITASGIQDYIFNITERKASARLRGRSARLGLVTDLCLLRLQEKFKESVVVKRNAGSRLEIEIPASDDLREFLGDLRRELDEHSRRDLNAEVWFAIGCAADEGAAHHDLDGEKLSAGKVVLQSKEAWDQKQFLFDRWPSERALQDPNEADATTLPEAELGRELVDDLNHLITFSPFSAENQKQVRVLNHLVSVEEGHNYSGLCVALQQKDGNTVQRIDRRLARYAPKDNKRQLLDLGEIADYSSGAKFLGVLKADLDGLGETFQTLKEKEVEKQDLSRRLDELFTTELESIIRTERAYRHIYVVYSGGDDLFLLGPWDKLIRFVDAFQSHLAESLKADYPRLTLSAGFKLAHPKSPVRFLADDVETALETAKEDRNRKKDDPSEREEIPHKNCICIFERIMNWDEMRSGLGLADELIPALGSGDLPSGFLQRMHYYADQFRWFEAGHIEGLRMAALLQNDWFRNQVQIEYSLRERLSSRISKLLLPKQPEASVEWRVWDFASRFAVYAARKKEDKSETA
jgi:CRISPR-associated protein Csm1